MNFDLNSSSLLVNGSKLRMKYEIMSNALKIANSTTSKSKEQPVSEVLTENEDISENYSKENVVLKIEIQNINNQNANLKIKNEKLFKTITDLKKEKIILEQEIESIKYKLQETYKLSEHQTNDSAILENYLDSVKKNYFYLNQNFEKFKEVQKQFQLESDKLLSDNKDKNMILLSKNEELTILCEKNVYLMNKLMDQESKLKTIEAENIKLKLNIQNNHSSPTKNKDLSFYIEESVISSNIIEKLETELNLSKDREKLMHEELKILKENLKALDFKFSNHCLLSDEKSTNIPKEIDRVNESPIEGVKSTLEEHFLAKTTANVFKENREPVSENCCLCNDEPFGIMVVCKNCRSAFHKSCIYSNKTVGTFDFQNGMSYLCHKCIEPVQTNPTS